MRILLMVGVIPGQKTDDSARAVIAVTPWCAEWREARISCLRDAGTTMRSLYKTTTFAECRCSRNWWYYLIAAGNSRDDSDMPDSIKLRRVCISSSLDVAVRILSHVTDVRLRAYSDETAIDAAESSKGVLHAGIRSPPIKDGQWVIDARDEDT